MRVAFYAPMKPPDHPVPSGDRRVAGLLMEALTLAGHRVELSSRLQSRDGAGDPLRQARLRSLGAALGRRLVRRIEARPASERPAAWLTYHLYYKAADWIGPAVCEALAIPYLVAEASVAVKRAGGPWDLGHRATLAALEQAAAVIALNPVDSECLPDPRRVRVLKPFLDPAPYRAAAAERRRHRTALAVRLGLDPGQPWLAAVAMMRPGDKLASYRLLARSLSDLREPPWQLVIVGDGPARDQVGQSLLRRRNDPADLAATLCGLRSAGLARGQRGVRHGVARGPGKRTSGGRRGERRRPGNRASRSDGIAGRAR
jgi:hypothetical protein